MPAFHAPIDLTRNELRNAVYQNLGTEPANPVVGLFYWDTTLNRPRIWNGTGWADMVGAAGTVTAVNANAPLNSTGGTTPTLSISAATTGAAGSMSATDKAKLDGVATGATANQTDAHLLNRANHTGTQVHTTISDFDAGVQTNRLDQLAAPAAAVAFNGQRITGLADGTATTDAATFGQLSAAIQGFDWKAPVRVVATTNVTLSGIQTIDGVAVVAGDRVLAAGQTSGSANGIYVVAAGAWARADDMNTAAEANNATVFVEAGTAGGGDVWTQTANVVTLGTTVQTWNKAAEGNTVYTADNATLALTGTQFAIKAGGVGPTQLATGVAGNGLTGGGGSALAVGAGTGISVAATTVSVDTAVVARKYSADLGAATSTVLTHNLNTRDVQVTVREVAAPYAQVFADVEMTSVNTVTIRFATAPAAGAFRATIVG